MAFVDLVLYTDNGIVLLKNFTLNIILSIIISLLCVFLINQHYKYDATCVLQV